MLLHIILFGFLNFQFKKKNCMKMQIQSIGVQNGGGGGLQLSLFVKKKKTM